MITEYMLEKLMGFEMENIKDWTEQNKGQKILLKCFQKYYEKDKDNCIVDKDAILNVKSYKIQPNYEVVELIKNLNEVFDRCIITDDPDKEMSIMREIAYNYLNEAKKEMLKLYHLDEDIHRLSDKISKNAEKNSKQHGEIVNEIKDMRAELKKGPAQKLSFIDELDMSRMFWYITLKVSESDKDFLYEILNDVEEEVPLGSEFDADNKEYYTLVDINFFYPVCQSDLREFLEALDAVFSENNIGIYGVYTHD